MSDIINPGEQTYQEQNVIQTLLLSLSGASYRKGSGGMGRENLSECKVEKQKIATWYLWTAPDHNIGFMDLNAKQKFQWNDMQHFTIINSEKDNIFSFSYRDTKNF